MSGTADGVEPWSGEACEVAPAKINLALHVTGRRDDGYHLLDMLVIHGGAADRLLARPLAAAEAGDEVVTLTITGRFAAGLAADPDNLVLRAARLVGAEAERLGRRPTPVALTLEKSLPIASGIGGGSSDAAATLRLLDRLWGLGLGRDRLAAIGLALGADVPMCVDGRPLRARGIGDRLEPVAGLGDAALVLVNPGLAVSTPAVFRALVRRDNPGLPDLPARFAGLDDLVRRLAATRNDLEAPAIDLVPAIGAVIARLRAAPGCRFARMSGSGATCFGLFADLAAAEAAAAAIAAERPDWWTAAGRAATPPSNVSSPAPSPRAAPVP